MIIFKERNKIIFNNYVQVVSKGEILQGSSNRHQLPKSSKISHFWQELN